ncbi:hypothetical protein KBD69_02550 [Candidatus Woesebacteria bacterium]|nr:hypothetical protein [Candidatus Woesebacteria bacterium]
MNKNMIKDLLTVGIGAASLAAAFHPSEVVKAEPLPPVVPAGEVCRPFGENDTCFVDPAFDALFSTGILGGGLESGIADQDAALLDFLMRLGSRA